jgi:putative transposase
MIDRTHALPVTRQCQLLNLNRSSVYYQPAGASDEDLRLMRRIDEMHLKRPFYGSRRIRDWLQDEGFAVNRKRVQRLMRQMGITALYPKANTSRPGKGHKIYPYLLKGLDIDRPNQVWAADICYVPMARGFVYVVTIMDWHSRKVLAWRVANTMDADFCVEALEEALCRYGVPEIFNTDQGAQFTSEAFTGVLKAAGIRISIDGKGRWVDNVFVERLWRSLKYEEVYLKAYETVAEARQSLANYFRFYKRERRHQGLNRQTPDKVYEGSMMWWAAA